MFELLMGELLFFFGVGFDLHAHGTRDSQATMHTPSTVYRPCTPFMCRAVLLYASLSWVALVYSNFVAFMTKYSICSRLVYFPPTDDASVVSNAAQGRVLLRKILSSGAAAQALLLKSYF